MNITSVLIRKFKTFFWTAICSRQIGSYEGRVYINNRSRFTSKVACGENCHFNGLFVHGRGNVYFGSNFHSGAGCQIFTENHNTNGSKLPYDETFIIKDVDIKENVWIGANVIILPGVSIGEGAVIQAGSVVSKSIPNYAYAGGNPAKVFKYRDSHHYEKLKDSKSFF